MAATASHATPAEDYLLLLLSDSNLPTGGFVASGGLESSLTHGFFNPPTAPNITRFITLSLTSYARLALPFLREVWLAVSELERGEVERVAETVGKLDDLYDSMLLNHVARRASQAQGAALLLLYSKALAPPLGSSAAASERGMAMAKLIALLKDQMRRNVSTMHLPICFGALCAVLELHYARAAHLHLFLYARSLLSSAVRLNAIGPYISQHILLHEVRGLIDSVLLDFESIHLSHSDRVGCGVESEVAGAEAAQDEGPATTWPLGEILSARHDNVHVRLFNS